MVRGHYCLFSKSQMLQHQLFLLTVSFRQDLSVRQDFLEKSYHHFLNGWENTNGKRKGVCWPEVIPVTVLWWPPSFSSWVFFCSGVGKSCVMLRTNSQQCLFCCHAKLTGCPPWTGLDSQTSCLANELQFWPLSYRTNVRFQKKLYTVKIDYFLKEYN